MGTDTWDLNFEPNRSYRGYRPPRFVKSSRLFADVDRPNPDQDRERTLLASVFLCPSPCTPGLGRTEKPRPKTESARFLTEFSEKVAPPPLRDEIILLVEDDDRVGGLWRRFSPIEATP